jgi:hypothetical protein
MAAAAPIASDEQALNNTQQEELERLEGIIQRGRETFEEVCGALWEISAKRLWRETHTSFERYCKDKWDFGKSHAYRMLAAGEVLQGLSPIGDVLPSNESQLRALVELKEPKERQQALADAVAETRGKLTTAALKRSVRKTKEAAASACTPDLPAPEVAADESTEAERDTVDSAPDETQSAVGFLIPLDVEEAAAVIKDRYKDGQVRNLGIELLGGSLKSTLTELISRYGRKKVRTAALDA